MSKKKTIFDIYRENDANFSSQPSNDAWSKLEGRLDGKSQIQPLKKKGRVIRMNFLSIAAGFLILVGIGSFFLLQSGNNAATESAVAFNNSKKYQTEDLILTDSDNDFFNEQRIAAAYKARFASNKMTDKSILADDSGRSAKKSKNLQPRRINQKPQELIAYNDDLEKNAKENSIYDQIEKDLIEKIETKEIAVSSIEMADYPEDPQMSPAMSRTKAVASMPAVNNSIQNFDWLVGNWEQEIGGMKSIERWVADTFNTISGTGYLVQGDDTIFTERPTIKQIGNKIYFFQNIESSESLVPYELMVQTDSQWVFENKNPNLPQEVILKRGASDFQIELRNTSASNQSFLKQRNALISNTARRNLKRTN